MVNIVVEYKSKYNRLKAEIITIGDEILIGQIIDTNSAWLGRTLNKEGIDILNIQSISDDKNAIKQALDLAFSRADLVLMTGGLGPTQDDITRETLLEYFDDELEMNERVLEHLEQIFHKRGRKMLDINRGQAMVPKKSDVLFNIQGTAPAMLFKHNGKWLASMPGVPYEMKHIVTNELLPQVRSNFNLDEIKHRTITTYGIPESLLAKKIAKYVDQLPANMRPAYLPNLNIVRFRLSGRGGEHIQQELDMHMQEIIQYLGRNIVLSEADQTPAEYLMQLLKEKNLKVTMAESCTGGYVAHQLTCLPGASAVFKGSLVAYDYDVKTTELGVPGEVLLKTGAVSKDTVEYMCTKVREKYRSDIGIGISGIAGPEGGTDDKPVGTVYVGVSDGINTHVQCYHFHGDRIKIIQRTSNAAYNMARKLVLGIF